MLPRIYRIFSKQKWLAIVLVLGGCAMTSPDPYQTTPSDQRKQRVAGTVLASQLPFGRDLPVVNNKPYADMYFKHYGVNPTIDTGEENVSTFSVDVDTASYTIARAYLERGAMPDEAAIRIEEFINAFDYHYAPPEDYASEPFSAHAELFPSPVRKGFHLLHLGLKAREVADQQRQPANLIFVVDASGSMARENRLGLVKKALRLLVDQLQEGDSVGLVIYESVARVILEPTPAYRRGEILRAIEAIEPGGSTNAGEGLRLGYQLAERRLLRAGINRVILCSDGVANTGVTGSAEILDTIREQADKGITLTTVGFGMGNYNDVLMEQLAQKANGNYYYVDREAQARRVFREQLTGILQTVAKDVKVQVVFDPNTVSRYRLLGYENRHLEASDFANDRVDAGELGSGHTVTALYEVKLRGRSSPLGRLRLRYKPPKGGASRLMDKSLGMYMARDSYADASAPAKLSVAVAAFAEKLRGSYWVRHIGYDDLLRLHGQIPDSLRGRADVNELRQLMYTARRLDRRGDKFQDEVPLSQMSFDHVPILR